MPNAIEALKPQLISLTAKAWTWLTNLPLPVAPSTTKSGAPYIKCIIQITGSWVGAISLECERAAAQTLAGAMFGSDHNRVATEDLKDAVAELINVIAGTIKPVLVASGMMSLPTIAIGSNLDVSIEGTHQIAQVRFAAGASTLKVRIHQADVQPTY